MSERRASPLRPGFGGSRPEAGAGGALIQCFNVGKRYVKGHEVIRDANLQIQQGQFVFLMGPSGAGKTTFLKLLLALEPLSEGQLVIDGRNLRRLPRRDIPALRRQVGMVFQDFKLLGSASVLKNVALPLEVVGRPSAYIQKKAHYILRFVGLEAKASLPCRQLSGGEQQRVAIARAVANDPKIVLADEPTGNLDECSSERVMELFKEIHFRGATVIVATHDARLPGLFPESRKVRIEGGRFHEDAPIGRQPCSGRPTGDPWL